MTRKIPFKRRPRPPLLWVVIVSGILCALLIFIGIKLWTTSIVIKDPIFHKEIVSWHGSPGQKVILVMGVDAPNISVRKKDEDSFEGTRTDTMMLVRVNSNKKRVSVVSIPRDSKVYIAGNRGIDKINAAHAIGGPDLAVQTVQDSFGIPIDNFIVINFKGVREVVDALGGIDLFIEKSMHYTDRTAKLFIDFEPVSRPRLFCDFATINWAISAGFVGNSNLLWQLPKSCANRAWFSRFPGWLKFPINM
jgi:LCP family protein required for cell wall assembly